MSFRYSFACSAFTSSAVRSISCAVSVISVWVSSICNVSSYCDILSWLCIPLNRASVSSGFVFNISIMLSVCSFVGLRFCCSWKYLSTLWNSGCVLRMFSSLMRFTHLKNLGITPVVRYRNIFHAGVCVLAWLM